MTHTTASYTKKAGRWGLLISLLILCLTACDNAESTYSNLRARYTNDNVMQVPPLRIACESKEEFCLIFNAGTNFVFKSFKDSYSLPITDLDRQKGFIMGLSGFFVGQPAIPDDGNPMVCYDAACPNCYTKQSMTKRLQLTSNNMAQCPNCQREYFLGDHGYLKDGKAGDVLRLIRYRAYYQAGRNTLIISN